MWMRAIFSLVLALLFTAGVLLLTAVGVGPLPALGPTFNPATGVWTMAQGAHKPTTETLAVPGLSHPVTVTFGAQGTPYIHAATTHDLFVALGYLQAKNRLFEMDLMRRQGEGLLSQIVGRAALGSDRFELELGLLRTARANWATLGPSSRARQALLAFSTGVNDVIRQDERTGTLPVFFKLLGYRPAPWTPIDSLVVQGVMNQDMSYTTAPIEYNLLVHTLGYARTMAFFPIDPANVQHPYDTGPYVKQPLQPMPPQTAVQTPFDLRGGIPTGALTGVAGAAPAEGLASSRAASSVLGDVAALAASFRHSFGASNNWAVMGTKTASGQAMLAGDPHLTQTLPSVWYQVAGVAPGYNFSGVSIPGTPAILIGYNRNIAWSLTDGENQATFFYQEQTSPAHPNQYYWDGAWRSMNVVHYTIPVKGGASVPLTVRLTVHGPLMTQSGETLAVDWIGALPSPDIGTALAIMRASNFAQFRTALSRWNSPTMNFIYADRFGNVGLISAGYYAQVAQGKPWMVLSGTGAEDIVGAIPYGAIPEAYDPKTGFVFSANQRMVSASYPYYIGTSMDFFTNGFRANKIYSTLAPASHLTVTSFTHLQNNIQDVMAVAVVPHLLSALKGQALSPTEQAAAALLRGWHGNMTASSPQATVWWFFLGHYLTDTFGPWWQAGHVPVSQDANLQISAISEVGTPLVEDLAAWTTSDPGNAAFAPPGDPHRTASQVMVAAFRQTVAELTSRLGSDPSQWAWQRVHFREFSSLAQVKALGYGPRGSSGDAWTVDAADGGLISHAGPSWRMIVAFAGAKAPPTAWGVYPGGQSENPLSPLYKDQIAAWWTGHYYPMHTVSQEAAHGPRWTLTP